MKNVLLNSKEWISLEDLEGERWAVIEEHPFYAISNYGRLKRLDHVFIPPVEKINQYTLNGELVRHYSNKGEVDDAGFNVKTILRVCNHTAESADGYVWRFEGEPFTPPSYNDSKGGTIKKEVLQYDLDGHLIARHYTLLDAALAMGGKHKRSGICECAYGKKKQAFGFIWKYAKEK